LEIRIGVIESQKEISLQVDDKPEDLAKRIDDSVKNSTAMMWFVDDNGKRVGIPTEKLAYVEIDPESQPRSVGFGP
jgi:uncharacterized protein DUF3107